MKKIPLFLFLSLLVLFFTRCTIQEDLTKLTNQLDSVQIVIGNPAFNTLVHVEFMDAKTKSYIENKTISVTLNGDDAASVYDNLGTKHGSYTSKTGMMDFIIDPHDVDTTTLADNPLEFDITVSIEGYTGATQKVRISEAKIHTVVMTLVNLADAPEGLSVSVNNNFAQTQQGVVQNTGSESLNGGAQQVTVPAGTILKDESGNALSGGVQTEIVYYSPTSETAQEAFPGGREVSVINSNNQEEEIRFVSAGMFNVRMTADNKIVKTLENGGITLKTTVPEDIINPYTGQPVKDRDIIELWSIDEGSGEWKYEKTDTFHLVNGKLTLEETVKHLSSWNWDFKQNMCNYGPKFIFKGSLSGTKPALIRAVSQSFTKSYRIYVNPADYNYSFEQIMRTPSGVPTRISFEDAGYNPSSKVVFSPSYFDIANLCDGVVREVTVSEQVISNNEVTVNFDLSASSKTDSSILVRPNIAFYYRYDNTPYNLFVLSNGKASVKLRTGVTYSLLGYFGSTYGKGSIFIEKLSDTQARITFTPQLLTTDGSPVQAVTIPVQMTNNTINVVYKVYLSSSVLGLLQ